MRRIPLVVALGLAFCVSAWMAPEHARAGGKSKFVRFVARQAGRLLAREWRAQSAADSVSAAPVARPPRKPPW